MFIYRYNKYYIYIIINIIEKILNIFLYIYVGIEEKLPER